MKIPKTTKEQPYIQYRIHPLGKITFELSSAWWGGIRSGFHSSDGTFGNACLPKDLKRFIKRTLDNRVKKIEKEIKNLEAEKKKAIALNEKIGKSNKNINLISEEWNPKTGKYLKKCPVCETDFEGRLNQIYDNDRCKNKANNEKIREPFANFIDNFDDL